VKLARNFVDALILLLFMIGVFVAGCGLGMLVLRLL
jgi:hypothetical protein